MLELGTQLPLIQADPLQLQRAFLNLWRNAVQAMEDNPADRRRILCIRTVCRVDAICIAFEDSGAGIPPDVRSRIFTPFFTTKRHGTGLGLAVVRKIADDHGGTIEVQESQHGGAAIVIALPRRRS